MKNHKGLQWLRDNARLFRKMEDEVKQTKASEREYKKLILSDTNHLDKRVSSLSWIRPDLHKPL